MTFHGSYRPGDVELLLTPIILAESPNVAEKERLIQSGKRHYSEMLTPEQLPSPEYFRLFEEAKLRNGGKMGADCMQLAKVLQDRFPSTVVIVSLARAGTPVGAILKHILEKAFKRKTHHYSLSIIRDRGIDAAALDHIRARHRDQDIVFVDGWTGKGVITRELHAAISHYNAERGSSIRSDLYVLADLCGVASYAASHEDYLIPSAILNATVSGLVSRSILNSQIPPGQFHGCVLFDQFAPYDQSVEFVEEIAASALQARNVPRVDSDKSDAKERCRAVSARFVADAQTRYGVADPNLVKPGIGEATRALLRRLPDLLILKDQTNQDVAHLIRLAHEKGVQVEVDPLLPYNAVTLIRRTKDGG